jgi:hypothetical protein
MNLEQRIDNYARETGFPCSLFISEDGRIVGTWIMGNDYRVKSEYYGGYPAGYLRRIRALFPDKHRILHIFSGKVDVSAFPGDTVDINPALKPTYVDDAQSLAEVPIESYDLILADPPYSIEDANRYQTTMIKRNSVLRALQRVSSGTHIVWLDQVLPMYRKAAFAIDAVIGMVKSTNHRFRVVTVFRRLGPDTEWATGSNTEKIAYGAHKRSTQTTLEPPKSAVRHLNAFPTSLGVDPLGMFGVKPEYRYRRRARGTWIVTAPNEPSSWRARRPCR